MRAGWEYKKIKEVCSFIGDGDWIESKDQSDSGIRLIQTGNIGTGIYRDKADKVKYISNATFSQLSCTEIFEGDCLLSRLPDPIGRSCLLPKLNVRTITAVDCTILRFKADVLPTFFVYYTQSNSYYKDILSKTTGTTRKRISRKNLEKIGIPIPPKPTQLSIVSELDKLNELIRIKKEQLKDYDTLAQSIFYEMFGDPVVNEKGWEMKTLGHICEITSSKRVFANEYVDTGVPFYRSKEVIEKSKQLPISVELYISESHYNKIKSSFGVPQIGDILVTAVGTIGKIWVVDTNEPFYFKDGNLVWLRNIKGAHCEYFRYSLFYLIDEYKKVNANGAAYNALTIAKLKLMLCPLPPLSLQQSFAHKIEQIERQKAAVQSTITDLETLLAVRMQYWFD